MTDPFGLDLPLLHAGKVRRLYDLPDADGAGRMLLVATDNISAFDYVLDSQIPDKGAILNQLSLWWFDARRPEPCPATDVPDAVRGRAVIVEKLAMVPVEAVARGYLTGSGWTEYQQTQSVCGVPLPPGLRDGDKLPEPIFTPAAKAPLGEHDENITYAQLVDLHGETTASELKDATLAIYTKAAKTAAERGIILADTKFEFGRRGDGTLVLADEVLTPDSSRFWDASGWRPGQAQPSFDKQYVRDWLATPPDRRIDAPLLPPSRDATLCLRRAYSRLTGTPFDAS